MSWEVVLVKTETNSEDISSIIKTIPFDREVFVETVKRDYPDTCCDNETCLVLARPAFSIEFIIGGEPVDCIILKIRGSNENNQVVSHLCKEFKCRAMDCSTGAIIETQG